jgi:peptidoglycan-associated lipoprotein
MKLFSKKVLFVLLSAALAFTGCTKKPKRPDPSSTVMGPGAGGGINPSDVPLDGAAPGTALSQREGVIEDENTIRGLLQAVYFDFDSSAVKASERPKVADAKKYLEDNPQYRILFEGRCDWRGTAEYNLGLGDRRANQVRQYAQSIGIPAAKIEVLSKGDLEATENAADDIMAKDRRVEIVVLKK